MENFWYSKDHQWIDYLDEKTVRTGISDYMQGELGDIYSIRFPAIGENIACGEIYATIESTNDTLELYAPVSGEVLEINEDVHTSPDLINEDALEAWLVEIGNVIDTEASLSEEEYETFLKGVED